MKQRGTFWNVITCLLKINIFPFLFMFLGVCFECWLWKGTCRFTGKGGHCGKSLFQHDVAYFGNALHDAGRVLLQRVGVGQRTLPLRPRHPHLHPLHLPHQKARTSLLTFLMMTYGLVVQRCCVTGKLVLFLWCATVKGRADSFLIVRPAVLHAIENWSQV